jgi:hypothetical protein
MCRKTDEHLSTVGAVSWLQIGDRNRYKNNFMRRRFHSAFVAGLTSTESVFLNNPKDVKSIPNVTSQALRSDDDDDRESSSIAGKCVASAEAQ